MDDIFSMVREGRAIEVRVWLDNTENDLNQGDDHRFSLLHWAAKEGRVNIVEMLLNRGARVNATNMGDDTALHLAAAHGHKDIVSMLIHNKANVNAVNEHGNTPLHYACFWGYDEVAEDLVNNGALVALCNRIGECPLDKSHEQLARILEDRAIKLDQNMERIPFKDRSWLGYKTRSRDATLSRHSGIDLTQLNLTSRLSSGHSGEIWRGAWQDNEIVAKFLSLNDPTVRMSRDFNEEYPRLRIFNNPNVMPVLGVCNQLPNLVIISQFMPCGSLYNIIHGETGIVIDQNQALRFAVDIARGMEFLHSLEPMLLNLDLNSKHVLVDYDLAKVNVDDVQYVLKHKDGTIANGLDEELTARVNMGDYKFTFHEKHKEFNPAWLAPEAMQKAPHEINKRAADMWSFAVLLWELATREVPFAELSAMECGMKVALEGLRVTIPPGTSMHMARLIKICMNEDPGKRPKFDMVLPILEKMKTAA